MKKIQQVMIAMFMVVIAIFIVGCEKQDVPTAESTAEYVPYKHDFEKSGIFYTVEEFEALPFEKMPGRTPEHAQVLLIFKENGQLYTPQELQDIFPKLMNHEITLVEYFTDLETFRKITRRSNATVDYVQGIPDGNGGGAYVYDAYMSEYLTNDQLDSIFLEKLKKNESEPTGSMTGDTVDQRSTTWPSTFLQNARILKGS